MLGRKRLPRRFQSHWARTPRSMLFLTASGHMSLVNGTCGIMSLTAASGLRAACDCQSGCFAQLLEGEQILTTVNEDLSAAGKSEYPQSSSSHAQTQD